MARQPLECAYIVFIYDIHSMYVYNIYLYMSELKHSMRSYVMLVSQNAGSCPNIGSKRIASAGNIPDSEEHFRIFIFARLSLRGFAKALV